MISLGPVTFAKPLFLFGALGAFAFWIFLRAAIRRHERTVNDFIPPAKQAELLPGVNWPRFRGSARRIALCTLFAFLSLARPQWGEHEEERKTNGLDIFVAVDVSNSMDAEDVVPSRLKRVKYMLKLLAERETGDRLGLVAFAGSAQVVSPLTTDTSYFREVVDSLSPSMVANQGTDLGAALMTSLQALARGAEDPGSKENESSGSRVILLASDGEDHEDSIGAAIEQVKKTGTLLYVFGVGTEKGAPIPVRDANGMMVGNKRDRSGNVVMTRFTGETLKDLAQKAGGKFWAIGNGDREVNAFLNEMGSLAQGERREKRVKIREERFQVPLALAVLFLCLDLYATGRRRRKASATRAAALSATATALIFLALLTTSARAQAPKPAPPTGPAAATAANAETTAAALPRAKSDSLSVYLKNRSALDALSKKDVGRAKEILSEVQLDHPDLPELQYNQGELHAAEGEAAKAGEVFRSTAERAGELQRPDLAGPSYFNAGAVRDRKKEKAAAIADYLHAIDEGKKAHDPELVYRARKNLQLLTDPQNGGGGSGESDPKQDPKDNKDGDQSQKDQSGKNPSNGDQDPKDKDKGKDPKDKDGGKKPEPPENWKGVGQKKPFRSENLSPEAAEQVMNELSQKEKQLQERLQQQKGRPQSLEKDW